MSEEEKEYNVIILRENGKEVRLTVKTADPFALKDELKIKYGNDTIISFEDPNAATKLRG